MPETAAARPKVVPAVPRTVTGQHAGSEGDMLVVSDIGVHFGGVSAVDERQPAGRRGEIVGLDRDQWRREVHAMNAIGGFCTATGSVLLHDRDISHLTPAKRARLGLGRTFQEARLFPELTVRETVQVALEARHRYGPAVHRSAASSSHQTRARRKERRRARSSPSSDSGDMPTTTSADLSTGTRRIVELAGLLALDARMLCLDEPTAGVAQRETEAFGPLLLNIRKELGAAMLIIEHDMPLIMGISDRVTCLEAGSGHRRRKPCRGTRRSARHRQLSRDR